jgi:small subunit ribosomal protein S6
MKQYELLYIIPAKYTEAEIGALTEKIGGIVAAGGAKVVETHQLGKRRLAYPIENVRNGSYVMSYVEGEPEAMAKVEMNLRLSTDLVRHLIIERDARITKIPSLVETAEERGGERGERGERRERREGDRNKPSAPKQQAAAKGSGMTEGELDKKLDKILTEEVL